MASHEPSESSKNTHLRIRLHAANLPRQGRFLKSPPDTFAVITSISSSRIRVHPSSSDASHRSVPSCSNNSSSQRPQGVIWGRTETIFKCSNPQWTECVAIDYVPGQELFFYVHLFQHMNTQEDESESEANDDEAASQKPGKPLVVSRSISQQQQPLDFTKSLGSALFEVSNVLASSHYTRVKRLRNGGCIFCRLEQYSPRLDLSRRLQWQFAASELVLPHQRTQQVMTRRRRRRRRRPVALLVELAKRPAGKQHMMWVVTHRSNVVFSSESSTPEMEQDALNVVWEQEDIDLATLCNGDMSQPILITVKQLVSNREQTQMKVIGVTETNLQHLLRLGEVARDLPPERNDDDDTNQNNPPTEQLSAAVTGELDESFTTTGEETSDLYAEYSSSEDEQEDDGHAQAHQTLGLQAAGQDGNERPLRPNELLLQRSQIKFKRVGRLQVLLAEFLSAQCEADGTLSSAQPRDDRQIVEVIDLAVPQSIGHDSKPRVDPSMFQHYLSQGLELQFCVAIDFTSSNGNPRVEGTDHYQDPNGALNDYEETILAVGKAIEVYSRSKEYHVWGFGAKFNGVVRHLFQLGPSPTVSGVDGILAAYRSTFALDLTMSGPSVLMEVMQKAAVQAKAYQADESPSKLRYNVLLIITDGLADSFEETCRKVAVYSQVALSIVIVGVGTSSGFEKMYQLTAAAQGYRRNVSFVEFRKHQDHPGALGAMALQDIPAQVCEYMSLRGLYR